MAVTFEITEYYFFVIQSFQFLIRLTYEKNVFVLMRSLSHAAGLLSIENELFASGGYNEHPTECDIF